MAARVKLTADEIVELQDNDRRPCNAQGPKRFICTRARGHAGRHLAGGAARPVVIYEVWED